MMLAKQLLRIVMKRYKIVERIEAVGASPAILKQVLSGKTGWELCLETLLSERYKVIR